MSEKNNKNESKESKNGSLEIRPGMLVRVHQKIKEFDAKGNPKEKVSIFEGIVIARRGGNTPGASFTVRKIGADGVGIEKIYPIHSPTMVKVELVKRFKVKKAKLYYLRNYKKKLKEIKQ